MAWVGELACCDGCADMGCDFLGASLPLARPERLVDESWLEGDERWENMRVMRSLTEAFSEAFESEGMGWPF